MLARLGSIVFVALTVSGVLDFVTTLSLCTIVIGIERACRIALLD